MHFFGSLITFEGNWLKGWNVEFFFLATRETRV